ncbi:hypothetical protein RN607_06020 [Demequina capsici]|uniref:Uncharacterized protein n=1 Tax=Demequina capsici TaxID=3075620 RepID=A0AA96JBL5_9MICO|nr:hypothetical protein [Demequina sp. PMTSA13]WNM28560.1 hypothetical protein RN607_06020 [Demequina sp. PMTSA13]
MLDWDEVRARIVALGMGLDDVILMGSGPMLAHGLVDRIGDVDLVARGAAWRHAALCGRPEAGARGDQVVRLHGSVEVFSGWFGRPADEVFATASRVDGILVGSLEEVLAFKLVLGRPKDLPHIAILREAIRRSGTSFS